MYLICYCYSILIDFSTFTNLKIWKKKIQIKFHLNKLSQILQDAGAFVFIRN
jgi:hypothetical protein